MEWCRKVMEGCGKLMELCGKSGGGSTFICFILVQCSPVAYLRALDQKMFYVGQELPSLIEWSTRSQKMYFFLVQCPTLGYYMTPDQNIFIHCFGPVVVDLKPLNYLPKNLVQRPHLGPQCSVCQAMYHFWRIFFFLFLLIYIFKFRIISNREKLRNLPYKALKDTRHRPFESRLSTIISCANSPGNKNVLK